MSRPRRTDKPEKEFYTTDCMHLITTPEDGIIELQDLINKGHTHIHIDADPYDSSIEISVGKAYIFDEASYTRDLKKWEEQEEAYRQWLDSPEGLAWKQAEEDKIKQRTEAEYQRTLKEIKRLQKQLTRLEKKK